MTSMIGNPYFADHLSNQCESNDGRAISTALDSLAYEQRTANLIEVWKWHEAQGDLPDTSRELYVEIVDRLGLYQP